jgi:hypothetical protein
MQPASLPHIYANEKVLEYGEKLQEAREGGNVGEEAGRVEYLIKGREVKMTNVGSYKKEGD